VLGAHDPTPDKPRRDVLHLLGDFFADLLRNVSMKMRHLRFEFSVDSISFARSI